MNSLSKFAAIVALFSACASTGKTEASKAPRFKESINAQNFYKGNLHTHTTASDGDVDIAKVVRWYQEHGYHFLSITDHDRLTTLKTKSSRDFVLLPGVEVTGHSATGPVHFNAICAKSKMVGPKDQRPAPQIAKSIIDNIQKDRAVAIFNHPNFEWAVSKDMLLQIDGFEMLEIASGHPYVNDHGDSSHPSAEELWDIYQTQRHRIFGVAVDDAHHYKNFNEKLANPGRAWVQVWAPDLSE